MSRFASRSHTAVVTLKRGETKQFRLPPTTAGTLSIEAHVIRPISGGGGGGIGGGGGSIPRRHDAGGSTVPPVVLEHDVVAAARPRRPPGFDRIRDRIRDLDVFDDELPPTTTPNDLKMQLLLGGSDVKKEHGSKLEVQTQEPVEAWQLKLTREAEGPDEQQYTIVASYSSILPVLEREIEIAAFQNAFDSNWNHHPYVTMEMRDSHFYVNIDEDFRELYGLENYEKDLSKYDKYVPGSIPDFTCAIRFAMRIEEHPKTARQAPVMIVEAKSSIGVAVTLWFFLDASGIAPSGLRGAGFHAVVSVRGIGDNIPGVDLRAEIEKALQEYVAEIAEKSRTAFAGKFTPWLIGEPGRELLDIIVVEPRSARFRVEWIGARPMSNIDPRLVGLDEAAASEPRPEPPPYLFDHPHETPPQGPPTPWEPRRRNNTTAGPLEAIQNIVVLMMENRSFDQVLGYLTREEGRTDVEGLSPDDRQHWEEYPDNYPRLPHRAETTAWPDFDEPNPGHHVKDVEKQMNGGKMDKFVANFDERAHKSEKNREKLLDLIKAYFGPEQLPAYRALTEEFAICDHWFTAHAGPTWPNRFITLTGDLNRDHREQVEADNPHLDEMTPAQALTIFDHLTRRDVSWRVYEHGYSFLRLYGRYTFDTKNIVDFRHPTHGFVADARAGRLPKLTFLEPDYVDLPPGNDDHPPADVADGQKLVATIVTALLDSPQWQNTMLIITYDEHGGFYDHVPPPDGPPLINGARRRGPRVPAFVVSPWIARGHVAKDVYDHTSIIATVLRAFCSPNPPRMSERADSANDLRAVLQATPRPRSDYDGIYARLAAIRDQPSTTPTRPPERLVAQPEPDDFHSVMRYVRSFT